MEQNKLLTTKKITYCAIFTALITIGAFIQIPVPFMDYFTLQFFFVLLAGILLGSKLGAFGSITVCCNWITRITNICGRWWFSVYC